MTAPVANEPVAGVRVLHCSYYLRGGGAERQLTLLTRALPTYGIESAIFCLDDQGREAYDPCVTIYLGRRNAHYDLGFRRDLDTAIGRFRPDVVHVWLPEVITVPAMLLARWRGCKVVFSYRWEMHFHQPRAVLEFACAAGFADTIISNHAPVRSQWPYRWLFRSKQGVVIRNAVDTGVVTGASQSLQRGAARRVLFAGRLTPMKNWRCLVEAFAIVRRAMDVQLVVCGEGEDEPALRQAASELGIADSVQILGFRNDLPQIMRSCDLFVLPSWREGSPNVVLEAMAQDLPCVLSDIGGNREMLDGQPAALLFDPALPAELARCMTRILEDPLATRAMVEQGRNIVADRSPDRLAAQHAAVYQGLVSCRTGLTSAGETRRLNSAVADGK